MLPKVEVRPKTLPRSGLDLNRNLALAMACLGLWTVARIAGRRLGAAADA